MNEKDLYLTSIYTDDNEEIRLYKMHINYVDDVKSLYYEAYGGKYSLEEITDIDKTKWAIYDPNYFWFVGKNEKNEIISSLIILTDPDNRVSKALAALVRKDYRRKHIMENMVKYVMDKILYLDNISDIIYAVTRTVSVAPQLTLLKLGFTGLGIFPNVRKIKGFETHGLLAYFKDGVLDKIKDKPILINPTYQIYKITKEQLNLQEAELIDIDLDTKDLGSKNLKFLIETSKEIEWEYYRLRKTGQLLIYFFPLHYPNIKLYTKDRDIIVYINYHKQDAHGDIIGIKTDRKDIGNILVSIQPYLQDMGIEYLELLIPATDPYLQKVAYEAEFIPCAYFPAFKKEGEKRIDYIVTAKSFSDLNFRNLKLSDKTKPYLKTFFNLYTEKKRSYL